MKEAMFYEKLESEKVHCNLCPHSCLIQDGKRGLCGVRENIGGPLHSLVYGNAIAENPDPIEKKPLYHVLPGSLSYSVSTVGCNFSCLHCQNSSISQMPRTSSVIPGRNIVPENIVNSAISNGCRSIAFTYTEPTIYFEYAYETARLAFENGLKNIFVTNGYINRQPLERISPFLHAANIDLKAFTNEFYNKICGAKLDPVLQAIRAYKELGIWVEITTLIIPGLNDKPEELRQIAEFICSIGNETPWHVTAFSPAYKLTNKTPTTLKTLSKARETGIKAGLKHVYTGNIIDQAGSNTYCSKCSRMLISRDGFRVKENNMKDSYCPECGTVVSGVFS